MDELPEGAELLLDGNRGIYLPQDAADVLDGEGWYGVKPNDLTVLREGPEDESYWEVWDWVLDHAFYIDPSERVFVLWQDGDLWLVPSE